MVNGHRKTIHVIAITSVAHENQAVSNPLSIHGNTVVIIHMYFSHNLGLQFVSSTKKSYSPGP